MITWTLKWKLNANSAILFLYTDHQTNLEDFETFADNLELNLDIIAKTNPFLTVFLDNFNAKLSKWYENNITSYEGTKIDGITSQFGMQQLINEPMYILLALLYF